MERVVKIINQEVAELFSKYPGAKIYGLTESLKRTGQPGLIPSIVDFTGEGKYVGIDDTAPLGVYHKNNSLLLKEQSNSYGDESYKVNVYSNSMIIFFDRSKIKMSPDEVHLFIQARMPTLIVMPEYRSIRFGFNSVNLNSQQVYQTEYQNGKNIDPKLSMISINYQIESVFSKMCFATCP